jgi:BirA family biotin operon repressor/biotin-[acetyl-CoA-carboxylase] ligase
MKTSTVESALAGLPIGGLRYYDRIASTNDAAAAWVLDGAADFSILIADEQTKGRGRSGRRWLTPPGSALAFSIILKETDLSYWKISKVVPRFTGLGALAVCSALVDDFGLPAAIKWPNDVIINDRKLCGVLVEASWLGDRLQALILGIGLNVTPQSMPDETAVDFPATCVEMCLGEPVERERLLRSVVTQVIRWRALLPDPSFIQAWEDCLAFRERDVQIVNPHGGTDGGEPIFGRVAGLNADGSLRMRLANGESTTIMVGEMHLRPVDSRE